MAVQQDRVLRVGVIWQGNLVVEQVVDQRGDVTVGTDPACTVVVRHSHVPQPPRRQLVATVHAGAWHVALDTAGGQQLTLRGGQQALALHHAVRRADLAAALVPIEHAAGGSWSAGDLTVLFQLVRPEPVVLEVQQRTILRARLVHDGRELAVHNVLAGEQLRIGSAVGDHLVLPNTDYQGPGIRLQLGRHGRGGTALVPKSAGLRVGHGTETPLDADTAVGQGLALEEGDFWQVQVQPDRRYRAALGPYVVLFQLAQEAVTRSRVRQLPLRQRLSNLVLRDATWTTSLGLTGLVIGALALQAVWLQRNTLRYLQEAQPEEAAETAVYPIEIELAEAPEPEPPVKDLVDVPAQPTNAPEPEVPQALKSSPAKAEPDKRIVAEGPVPRTTTPSATAPAKAGMVSAVDRSRANMGASAKIFADEAEDGTDAAYQQAFGQGDSSAEAGAGPSGRTRPVAEPVAGGPERITTKPQVLVRAPVQGEREPAKQETVTVQAPKPQPDDPADPNAGAVARAVARKQAAIRRCYELELRGNPEASGKVRVSFVVSHVGAVEDIRVVGASADLASCIEAQFATIRGLPASTSSQRYQQAYVFSRNQ